MKDSLDMVSLRIRTKQKREYSGRGVGLAQFNRGPSAHVVGAGQTRIVASNACDGGLQRLGFEAPSKKKNREAPQPLHGRPRSPMKQKRAGLDELP